MPPAADAPPLRLHLPDPDATAAFARHLASHLEPGDTLLLEGPIGAGKTHFARALILERLARAGLSEDVPSPTYTLVQTYDDGVSEIWHADLYRLSHPSEVVELGLSEAFGTAICLVEWPDRLDPADAPDALRLNFAAGRHDDERDITLSGGSPRLRQAATEAARMADA